MKKYAIGFRLHGVHQLWESELARFLLSKQSMQSQSLSLGRQILNGGSRRLLPQIKKKQMLVIGLFLVLGAAALHDYEAREAVPPPRDVPAAPSRPAPPHCRVPVHLAW